MMRLFFQVPKMLCIWLTVFSLASCSKRHKSDDNVRQVCSVTRYTDICIHSLAPYSKTAKNNHTAWARAGVSVALSAIKNTTHYLDKMNTSRTVRGLNWEALSDCVECFHDAKDSLHQSLSVLRELDKVIFDEQMSDVMTWVSAALTNEDTCLDGMDEEAGAERRGKKGLKRRRAEKIVIERVRNCTYVTSNALALLNQLASTGF